MSTVINTPTPIAAPAVNTGSYSFLIGVILLIAFVSVLLYFGIPAIQRMGPVQVNLPAPQMVLPDKVDVNVAPAK